MKRPGLVPAIGIALAILLALLFVYPQQLIAPGALMPGHADFQGDCFACHAPFRGPSSARCIACHVPAQIGLRTTKGTPIASPTPRAAFHTQLRTADCTACHSDHAANLFTARHRPHFDHGLLKPGIAAECATCHARPRDTIHAGITGGCAQCHRTSGWKPANFAHERFFQLDGAHNVACATCHTGGSFERYTCYGCHEHQPAQIAALHREEGIGNIENCVRCHRSARGEGGEGGERGGDDD